MKILWCLDAFEESSGLDAKSATVLVALARTQAIHVDPVYVLSPRSLGLVEEFTPPWAEKYLPAAKGALTSKLLTVQVPWLGEPIVLMDNRATLRGAVDTLVRYAAAEGYDLLVVSSHGKSGVQRLALGSFAEELLLQAKSPVLVVGHTAEVRTSIERVLIPNDLRAPGSPFIAQVFQFVKKLGATATLLNVITRPVEAVFQSGVYLLSGGWVDFPAYLHKDRTERKSAANSVGRVAEALGVGFEWIQDEGNDNVTGAIIRRAREGRADLIAIEGVSGRVASAVLGSVTREVLRQAPCPILVFRSGAEVPSQA